MALSCVDQPMSYNDILRWIAQNFNHYQAVHKPKKPSSPLRPLSARWYMLEQQLSTGVSAFEFPAKIGGRDPAALKFDADEEAWTMSPCVAQDHFQRVSGLERQGTFPFLDLPPELRNTIYEMFMSFPLSGVRPTSEYGRARKFHLVTKDSSKTLSMSNWFPSDHRAFRPTYKKYARQTLDLLLVNKQIFEEAQLCFYYLNTFYFSSVRQMDGFPRKISSPRRNQIRTIGFTYERSDEKVAPAAFRYLASMTGLQKIHVDIKEDQWLGNPLFGTTEDAVLIPGVRTLRSIRGLDEVSFSSACLTAADYLKVAMEGNAKQKRKRKEAAPPTPYDLRGRMGSTNRARRS